MVVEKDKVVSIQYTASDEAGNIVDGNLEFEPLEYLHGHGNILTGLENALAGLKIAEEKKVTLTPGEAYGDFNPELVFEVNRQQFPEGADGLQLGSMVQASDGQELIVTDIDGDKIILDGNHPFAGRTLQFAVTIKNIREASTEEISHGHVHNAHTHHQHEHKGDGSCGHGCGCSH
ncbi:peptidylprolyl isomerase [Terrimonas sp.]|uniref:FKBP-type peptidyl-prolyl cis-trans isomerase n=1 Tax=Terrimonas sp. TaxID=1914338 RepID=UPI000D5134BC|nr:peptidylprolyl isomerase [Terrimonas sp.]PVD49732.1 peptidylprolyl isomerase [Terrimonas sp.]PVD49954.1 peptidylprolyl isomerase [Terrimonas sp.]